VEAWVKDYMNYKAASERMKDNLLVKTRDLISDKLLANTDATTASGGSASIFHDDTLIQRQNS